jgi:hypothetical protein
VGEIERMHREHRDVADFYIVYIREAHASDSRRPVPYARQKGITEHRNFAQRCAVAEALVKEKKLTIPLLIDDMQNSAGNAYRAWPDRVYLVRTDGTLAVAGGCGPAGFVPALREARAWLSDFKRTGHEPAPKTPGSRPATSAPTSRPAAHSPCITRAVVLMARGANALESFGGDRFEVAEDHIRPGTVKDLRRDHQGRESSAARGSAATAA